MRKQDYLKLSKFLSFSQISDVTEKKYNVEEGKSYGTVMQPGARGGRSAGRINSSSTRRARDLMSRKLPGVLFSIHTYICDISQTDGSDIFSIRRVVSDDERDRGFPRERR